MEKSLEQLKQEYEKTTVLLEREKRKMQRLKNRQAYLESGSRKQRTHRLITRGAAVESIVPQTKELTETEFYSLMESILNLPQAEPFIRSAAENHARISGQEKGGDFSIVAAVKTLPGSVGCAGNGALTGAALDLCD